MAAFNAPSPRSSLEEENYQFAPFIVDQWKKNRPKRAGGEKTTAPISGSCGHLLSQLAQNGGMKEQAGWLPSAGLGNVHCEVLERGRAHGSLFVLPPRLWFPAWHSKTLAAAALGTHPGARGGKGIRLGCSSKSRPAATEIQPLGLPAALRHASVPKLAMGLCLILLLALGTVVVGHNGGQELATESPTTQQWTLCPPDDNPLALQEEELLVPRFSTCMLRCASRAYEAYRPILATGTFQSTVSLKLNEGRQGAEHEFCWMLGLRCQRGVHLTKAFVLLNLEQLLDQSNPFPFRLLVTAPSSTRPLLKPRSRSRDAKLLNREACGVRFDVTEPFRSAEGSRDTEMCVKVVCLEEDVCKALKFSLRCPLFLATLWRTLPRPDG